MNDQIAVQSNGISITADGQIIVSKLRPMNGLAEGESGLFFDEAGLITIGVRITSGAVRTEYGVEPIINYIGYMPLPIYKPE